MSAAIDYAAVLDALAREPTMFAEHMLTTRLWARQIEILNAVRDHKRVAIRSGHKCGKSTSLAVLALWWAYTHYRARVILTAASYAQVKNVLWKEIRRLYYQAKRAGVPLGGDMHELPDSGLKLAGEAEIIGLSAKDKEKIAGYSGPNMLFIADEASGIPDEVFEAIEGNRAGGARIAMISNPTQTSGYFYDAFHSDRGDWHCIHISSEECALLAPIEIGPDTGLATLDWVEEKKRDWGVDDNRYRVRVLGEFASDNDNSMISSAVVDAAIKRWPETTAAGPLRIGVDVARFGNDATAIVWSRGRWASAPTKLTKLDAVDVAGRVMQLVRDLKREAERPSVRVDVTGMGGGVADVLRREQDSIGFELVEIDAHASATVEGYSRMRDQVWGSLKEWLKAGGAIANDRALAGDLTAPLYGFDVRGALKVESKIDLRKRIGRSTDAADALALAVFEGADDPNVDWLLDGVSAKRRHV